MAQAAAFLAQRNFVMESILECRTAKDAAALFGVEASEYWTSHFVPAQTSSESVKRIGPAKANILGINVVAQLQYAYGSYIGDDRLRDMMDIKVFVDADADDRLIRVINRDCIERGRTPELVVERYERVLKPMHNKYIEPAKKYADLIIPQGGNNTVAIKLLKEYIEGRIQTNR